MDVQEQNRENVFHERAAILRDQGYGGFKVTKKRKKWEGVEVTVQNKAGRTFTASGETDIEAFTKLIDKIDRIKDEPQ